MKIEVNKPEALWIFAIFIIALFFAIIFHKWEQSSLLGFLTEFIATTLGVLLAFSIKRD